MERAAERLARQRARGAWRARLVACCVSAEPGGGGEPERARGGGEPGASTAGAPRAEGEGADLYSDAGAGEGPAGVAPGAALPAADGTSAPAADASEEEDSDSDWDDEGPAGGLSREEAEGAARALNFRIDRRLTPGSEGRVFVATAPGPAQERVVLKIGASASTLAEAMLLRTLDHPNVVKLKAVLFHGELVCAVLARYREDLHTRLWDIGRPMALPSALRVMRGVLRGLAYLHSRRIAHRDVKTENIFINTLDDVCLGDFGAARGPVGEPRFYGLAGTLETNSPELLARARYDCRTDVWSAGVVLYEMLAHPRALFDGATAAANAGPDDGARTCARQLLRMIRRLAVRADEFPADPLDRLTRYFGCYASARRAPHSPYRCLAALRLPRDAEQLAQAMLTFDFRRRPTAAELLERPPLAEGAE
ncbi:serine/threonine protein kinase US3 [Cervid alphaherpesvirus 2]|uniref:non-specific serine/threonine protein kinase n=1 Tax=Cervid alphaherpesvirus 2 TaxID=365327 RepID=A0A455JN99_9ALPH|nr:serine/threonine protein kinase US3 [Cervid alphaherpesvirus 2]AVT50786.1 serine/threonine protein kinase US3 [Cervid alphaherpesvirus 2]